MWLIAVLHLGSAALLGLLGCVRDFQSVEVGHLFQEPRTELMMGKFSRGRLHRLEPSLEPRSIMDEAKK